MNQSKSYTFVFQQIFCLMNGRWYRMFRANVLLKKVEVLLLPGASSQSCAEGRSVALSAPHFGSVFCKLGFSPSALKNPFHSVRPFVIASCIGMSAHQSLFKAYQSHAALSSVVFSEFSLLTLIILTSLKLKLEIYYLYLTLFQVKI